MIADQSAGDGIVPIAHEEHEWTIADEAPVSRSQRRRHLGPYRAAITAPIARLATLPLAPETITLAGEATAEIVRFDVEIANEIAPFEPLLLRSESAASSKIEHLTASAKAILLAELGDPSRQNAGIIVANTRAMQAAIALADRLDEQAILDMHAVLMGETHPDWVGHWRTSQVWIGGSDVGPHSAMFVPPHHARVPAAMHDLVVFMARDDLPPFIQAAIAHAQFETIHPFPDGNGRTGRALIHSLLRGKGVTRSITVPVSAGLLADTGAYFDALTAFRRGDLTPIVEQLAGASFLAVSNGRTLVEDLHDIGATWEARITARRGSAARRIAEYLLRQPVVDSALVQRELGLHAANVNAGIDHLLEVGILTQVAGAARNRKWAASQVLHALDAFAERAGRRRRA